MLSTGLLAGGGGGEGIEIVAPEVGAVLLPLQEIEANRTRANGRVTEYRIAIFIFRFPELSRAEMR